MVLKQIIIFIINLLPEKVMLMFQLIIKNILINIKNYNYL